MHIQEEKGKPLKHIEYLHKDQSDPRLPLTQKLIESCGDKGSIIVYYQVFEKSRNKELAELFPQYQEQLEALNERVVDLLKPFKERHIYHHKQNSSASIKFTLPAFTDMSYKDMEVKKGDEASIRYCHYLQNRLNSQEANILFKGLDEYCKQDTLAMVKLLEIVESRLGDNKDPSNVEKQEDIAIFSTDSSGQMGWGF